MANNIRCLLVDDEYLALALLEKYVSETPGLEVVATCKSPIRAVEILQAEAIDLLFLDIQMPILSGINLLKGISHKPITIFTTAYPQHAVEAYELDAVDYLLKPYSLERFNQAIAKAKALLRQQQDEKPAAHHGALTVKADRQWIRIPFSDIRYIEGWKEYVKIFTEKEKVITLESLNNLESLLPDTHFVRVHKSYIVAIEKVQKLDGDQLLLQGSNQAVPVARARKKEVIALLFK